MNENSSSEKENTKLIISELIDLLNDERSYKDIGIIIEITKTIHLLVKQGGSSRNEILSHPQVSRVIQVNDLSFSFS
jgi:hypothetical protein